MTLGELLTRVKDALLKEFEPELKAFTDPLTPARVCRMCFAQPGNTDRPTYYRFDGEGACHRCGCATSADNSIAIESL